MAKRARTNPHLAIPQEMDEDLTPPPIEIGADQVIDWKIERMRKRQSELGQAIAMIQASSTVVNEEIRRRVGDLELGHNEMRKAIGQIKEGQIGLAHVADQIFEEVKKGRADDKDARKQEAVEQGAWKRTFAQLLITAGALAVAIISLAMGKC